jgi:2-polyprenyl-3-methyl-5-hydroxy-6-metoxy-1,4-benzoquinol methylase
MTKFSSLTQNEQWDDYWRSLLLPCEAKPDSNEIVSNEILHVFDRIIPQNSTWAILEIGGAPGRFLAYLNRKYKFKVSSLDYSHVGSELTCENFKLMGLDIHAYEGDLFSDKNGLKKNAFDLVYSLGFIEHFQNIKEVVERHLLYVKPGGWLMIGVPHFIRTFSRLIQLFAPKTYRNHNLFALDLYNWEQFEKAFGLRIICKEYLGGLDLSSLLSVLNEEEYPSKGITSYLRQLLIYLLKIGNRIRAGVLRIFPFWRNRKRLNGKGWSAYAIGIYQKPNQEK